MNENIYVALVCSAVSLVAGLGTLLIYFLVPKYFNTLNHDQLASNCLGSRIPTFRDLPRQLLFIEGEGTLDGRCYRGIPLPLAKGNEVYERRLPG